jgi:hypothetical protein
LTFFQTDEGHLHLGRIAALLFTVSLVPGCGYFARIDPICIMHIVVAIGA